MANLGAAIAGLGHQLAGGPPRPAGPQPPGDGTLPDLGDTSGFGPPSFGPTQPPSGFTMGLGGSSPTFGAPSAPGGGGSGGPGGKAKKHNGGGLTFQQWMQLLKGAGGLAAGASGGGGSSAANGGLFPSTDRNPKSLAGNQVLQRTDNAVRYDFNPPFFNPNALQAYDAMGSGRAGFPSPFAGMGLLNPMTGGSLNQPWLQNAPDQLPPAVNFSQAYGTGRVQQPPPPPPPPPSTPPWMQPPFAVAGGGPPRRLPQSNSIAQLLGLGIG